MDTEILAYLEKAGTKKTFEPGEIIFYQGEAATAFFYLESGLSLTYTIMEDGRERNILISWPGRFFGASTLFEQVPRRASAIAIRRCEVLVITRQLYEDCARRYPGFVRLLLQELAMDLGVLFEQLSDSALLQADIKVARFICRRLVHGHYQTEQGVPVLCYTQEFIASVLGLSRWAVNQSLTKLRACGWIRTGHGKITVLDAAAIRRYGYGE